MLPISATNLNPRTAPRMIRTLLLLVLASSICLAQTTIPASNGQIKSSPAQVSAAPVTPPPGLAAEQVPSDAAVMTVHGLCAGQASAMSEGCATTITKAEFERMIAAM